MYLELGTLEWWISRSEPRIRSREIWNFARHLRLIYRYGRDSLILKNRFLIFLHYIQKRVLIRIKQSGLKVSNSKVPNWGQIILCLNYGRLCNLSVWQRLSSFAEDSVTKYISDCAVNPGINPYFLLFKNYRNKTLFGSEKNDVIFHIFDQITV